MTANENHRRRWFESDASDSKREPAAANSINLSKPSTSRAARARPPRRPANQLQPITYYKRARLRSESAARPSSFLDDGGQAKMTRTENPPKPTPIGGVGWSVSGLNRNGTETVFGEPPHTVQIRRPEDNHHRKQSFRLLSRLSCGALR